MIKNNIRKARLRVTEIKQLQKQTPAAHHCPFCSSKVEDEVHVFLYVLFNQTGDKIGQDIKGRTSCSQLHNSTNESPIRQFKFSVFLTLTMTC